MLDEVLAFFAHVGAAQEGGSAGDEAHRIAAGVAIEAGEDMVARGHRHHRALHQAASRIGSIGDSKTTDVAISKNPSSEAVSQAR